MANPVLVVDDSAMIRMQVKRALTGAGFAVVDAVDGQDAMDKLAAGTSPSMVVCDVNMPRMNGLEFLQEMRGHGGFNSVPVVMLTTEGQPELIRQARLLGAKGWLIKPFQPELLIATVSRLLAKAA